MIQAYLHRSEADIRMLNAAGGRFDFARVPIRSRRNWCCLTSGLLEGVDRAMATHDAVVVDKALGFVKGKGIEAGRFEFEMLYEVRRELQQMLVDGGFRLRLYVPYGDAWYPYFMRCLAERPANVWFVVQNLFRR